MYQAEKILIESGIADVDAVGAENPGFSVGQKSSDGKSHGNAVIQMAVDDSSMQRMTAFDDHSVFRSSDLRPHRTQVLHHYVNTVGFLDLQLLSVADGGSALGKAGKRGDDRDLIDQGWNLCAADLRAMERTEAHKKIRNGLSAFLTGLRLPDGAPESGYLRPWPCRL